MKCFNKSFASHPKAVCWDPSNEKTPRQTFLRAEKSVLFCCETCSHKWEASPSNVAVGKWCPACRNKTERILLEFLKKNFQDVKFNIKFEWGIHPDTKKQFRFDFAISNTIIELDGDQHFTQVGSWTCPKETRKRDLIRMKQSKENGFTTIRILQRDVYFNRYDWKSELLEAIRCVKSGQNMFLCKNGEYDEMKTQLKV
jgi:very-short-patch-repair endonuclease